MDNTTLESLNRLYPTPVIRGTRITRMEERELGRFRLTAEIAQTLGEDNIGVFIGDCKTLDRVVDRVREIDQYDVGGRWIIVPSTRSSAAAVYQRWLDSIDVWDVDPKDVPSSWHGDNVIFCLPESLGQLTTELTDEKVDVAGIILLDFQCVVHKARGFNNGDFRVRHDRPQLIVDFRSRLSIGNWAPPLILISQKPAKSVSTNSMQRAYCLEAFRFIDGKTLRCHRLPKSPVQPQRPAAGEPVVDACAC